MPKQFFINVHFAIKEELHEVALALLGDLPHQGIEEKDDELVFCFREEDFNDELSLSMQNVLHDFGVEFQLAGTKRIEQVNWNEEWERSLEPVIISERLAITPSTHAESVSHEIKIIIDPKMSFGTGYHATTRLVARFLEELVSAGAKWIDAGTGTGVLAIAALKLGAAHVYAFDFDEWAIENAAENLAGNKAEHGVFLERADLFTAQLPISDGIVANLHLNVLIPNMTKFHEALDSIGAPLIISGILRYDADEIISHARRSGFVHRETRTEDEWIAVHFSKG